MQIFFEEQLENSGDRGRCLTTHFTTDECGINISLFLRIFPASALDVVNVNTPQRERNYYYKTGNKECIAALRADFNVFDIRLMVMQ